MSTFATYKLSDSVMEYIDLVVKITEHRSPKQQLDFLFNLSTQLSLYKFVCVNYLAPQIAKNIIHLLQNSQNKLEDAYSEYEISDEEYEDYELMIQDAIERIQESILPEKSFFCTWINGEYFGIEIEEDGSIVETYKYDQKVDAGKKYENIIEWINEYTITVSNIEVGVCVDVDYSDYLDREPASA